MKKLLLFASAALVGSVTMVAEEIDITPKNYHFNQATALPIYNHGVHGANIQGVTTTNDITPPIFANLKAEEQWDNGLLVIGGGQFHNHDNGYYNNMVKGLQLVDLGGEVGQVLVWVGQGFDLKGTLKAATGYDYDITAECGGGLNWGNLNFFTDPKNTPTAKEGFIRTTITYQVIAPVNGGVVSDAAAMNNVQFKTDQNGTKASGGAWAAKDNFGYDENLEEDVYDPSIWVEYSIEGECPDSEESTDFFPMRATLNFPGSIASGIAFIIKDITFTQVTEGTPSTEQKTKKVTYTMGEVSGVKNITADKTFTFSVNGNAVTFSADAEIYTIAGVKVAAAAATQSVSLGTGMYIARSGDKAVKFVVK